MDPPVPIKIAKRRIVFMKLGKFRKIFGAGPLGLLVSLSLLSVFWWASRMLGHPTIMEHSGPLKVAAAVLVVMGLGLHFWTGWTLRKWWVNNQLCTSGPFKYLRHPMYAAWITFVAAGVTFYLNSWLLIAWLVLLHMAWHRLVRQEETMMVDTFGEEYQAYAARTGRFVPRVCRHF